MWTKALTHHDKKLIEAGRKSEIAEGNEVKVTKATKKVWEWFGLSDRSPEAFFGTEITVYTMWVNNSTEVN